MFRNKRIKELEEKMESMKKTIEEKLKALEFICKYDKNKIVYHKPKAAEVFRNYYITEYVFNTIEYLYDGCYHKVICNFADEVLDINKINDSQAIIHAKDEKNTEKFYLLDLAFEHISEITQIKQQYENQQKVAENLKDSAQALCNTVCEFEKIFAPIENNTDKPKKTRGRKKTEENATKEPKKRQSKKENK